MDTETYWVGSREHLELAVLDGDQPVADYQVSVLSAGASLASAVWAAPTVYAGERGVWIADLPVGFYSVFARTGDGEPNERAVVHCGYVRIRDRC